jgi:hypothetical protein
MSDINFLGIGLAVVADMGLGAFWYSPAGFGKIWMKKMGIEKPEDLAGANLAYASSALSALVLAMFFFYLFNIVNVQSTGHAMGVALLVWLGAIVPVVLPPYFWENRPKVVGAIYCGYKFFSILLMAVILTSL